MGAALKPYAWPALAGLAFVYLLVLALTGERPGPGLAAFEARGLLREVPVAAINAVELSADAHAWRFDRNEEGAWHVTSGPPISGLERELPTALTLLHNSAPERTFAASATPEALAEYGLAQPRLRVRVHAQNAKPFAIAFGGSNALASVRYARVVGSDDIVLLPAFVAEPWERLAGIP